MQYAKPHAPWRANRLADRAVFRDRAFQSHMPPTHAKSRLVSAPSLRATAMSFAPAIHKGIRAVAGGILRNSSSNAPISLANPSPTRAAQKLHKMLSLFSAQQSLVVGARAPVRSSAVSMAGTIPEELAKLQGPEIFWGSEGVELGYEESDIKGYDNFGKLCAAIDSMGLKDTLSGGEYTPLTADILKYHVIEGKVTQGAIAGNQKTLKGDELFYRRFARKTWLDDAIIGLKSEGPSKSSNWPSDVECSNGLIQAVDTVLVPGRFEAPPPDAY